MENDMKYDIVELNNDDNSEEIIAKFAYAYDAEEYLKYMRKRYPRRLFWCQTRLFDV